MRRYLLTLACLFCITLAHAQTYTIISPGTNMYSAGGTYNVPAGYFIDSGSYVDTIAPGAFNVNGGVVFSGPGTTDVYNFNFNDGTSVLNAPVTAYGAVTIGAGDSLNANGNLILQPGATLVVNGYIVNNAMGVTAMATPTSGSCPSFTSTLSTNVSGSVIQYQWQSSPDSSTWTSISGATNATYVATVTATSYYRANLTASNSSYNQNTNGVKLTLTPAPIPGGGLPLCAGAQESLTGTPTGGTWSSSDNTIATVGSTGVVSAIAAGTSTITYTIPGGACVDTQTITVQTAPTSIEGNLTVCSGSTTDLGDDVGSGTWSSNSSAVASIGSTSGVVTGGAGSGTAIITYTLLSDGCYTTTTVTTNALPATITGTMNVCAGLSTILTETTTGGAWSSDNTAVASVVGGTVTGATAGATVITYTSASGCITTTPFTVNALPSAITGSFSICAGGATTALNDGITGGSWSSSATSVASINSTSGLVTSGANPGGTLTITYALTSTGCLITAPFTVNPAPAGITGTTNAVCAGLTTALTETTTGGTWSSGNAAIATVGSTGIVTGARAGALNIIYTLPAGGCNTSYPVTVNALPAPITGPLNVCAGGTTTLEDAITGGAWSSSNMAQASVGSTSGIVTGGTGSTNPVITYTLPTGCITAATLTVNALPTAYNVTGGGVYCSGSAAPHVQLSNSTSSTNYQLFNGATPVGTAMGGSGSSLDFGPQAVAGTYSVTATSTVTGCSAAMTGSAGVTVNPLPAEYSVTGGGSYCSGGAGVVIGVSNSQGGVNYTLMLGATPASGAVSGTGSPISFSGVTAAGTYTVTAVFVGTGCANAMGGSATVSISTPPSGYSVTGGGGYCTGGAGVPVGLSGSTVGVSYQLVNGGPVGSPVSGTGSAITFGQQTTAGTYTVNATNIATGCTATMTGSVVVTVNPLPVAYTVSGGGIYCTGGVTVNLSGSQTGKSYQMYNGATAVGSPMNGNGSALAFTGVTSNGTITIVATDLTTLCTATMTGSATVSSNPLPTVYYLTGSGPYCANGAGEHIFLSFSNIGIQYQLYNSSGAVGGYTPGAASGLDFGAQTVLSTYLVVATNPSTGCSDTMSGRVTVTTNPTPALNNVTGGGSYCSGGTGVVIGLNGSATGINYQLRSGTATIGTAVAGTGSSISFGSETAAGAYFVTATNTTTGCNDTMTGTATVTVNPLPSAITGTTTVCIGNSTPLNDAMSGGTWISSNTGVATVGTSGSVFGVTAGTTVITYTLPTGCIATVIASVNPITPAISGNLIVCMGSTSTVYDVSGGGTWISSNTSAVTVPLSAGTLSSAGPGTSTITYTSTNGCTTSSVATVYALPATISGTLNICTGLATALSDTGSGSWRSSNLPVATVNGSGSVSGVTPGTTSITYTSAVSGCATSVIVTVNQNPAAITGPATVCTTSAITLEDGISGGVWSSGATATATVGSATGVVTGAATGNLSINYTMPSGCSATYPITVNGTPATIGGTPFVCTGTTISLTETTTGGAWSSSNTSQATVIGGTTATVGGITPGSPVITYSLPTGCQTSVTVSVGLTPAAISGPTTVCSGANITLSDVTTGGAWSSSNTAIASVNSTTGIVTGGTTTGPVVITYTGSSTCPASITITVNPTPQPIGGSPATVCTGSTIVLTESTTGGVWSSSNTASATVVGGTVSGAVAGNVTIAYTLGACAAAIPVTVYATPTAISGGHTVCTGVTTTLTDAVSGGTWSSSNSTFATVGSTNGIVTGVTAGTINVSYIMPSGCFAIQSMTVNTTPAFIGGTPVVCTGLTTMLTDATTGAGGTWASNNTSLATVGSSSGIVGGVSAGTPIISYIVATGCYVTTPVTVNTSPSAIIGNPNICLGLTSSFTDGSGTGTWTSNNTGIATINIANGVAGGAGLGTTTITYTLPSGCQATQTVSVTTQPASISGPSSLCTGQSITLTDLTSGGSWTSSNTAFATINSASGSVTAIAAGPYQINYILPTGCVANLLMTANQTPSNIGGPTQVCPGTTINLTETSAGGSWSSSSITTATVGSTGTVTGVAAGTAIITYTLPAGCTATAIITVNPLPAGITGSFAVCALATTSLNSTPSGGAWSSSNTSLATVGSAGIVTGVSAGNPTITYTLPTGCQVTAMLTVNQLPAVYATTGGGAYCAGGSGVLVGLSNTATGFSYQLYSSSGTVSAAIAGTGSAISFGLNTTAGSRFVLATNTATGCADTMSGRPIVLVNPTPATFYVTGGGSYCSGSAGVAVGLSGSVVGTTYQLYNGSTATGIPVNGNSITITFGPQTIAGTYTVAAVTTSTSCTSAMLGSVTVSVLPVPNVHNVTGGGIVCTNSTTGVPVGLNGSDAGITYELLLGTSLIATTSGTGTAFNFANVTTTGTYKIVAINPATSCTDTMLGTAVVTSSAPPTAYTLSASSTSYCYAAAAPTVSLSSSQIGVNYQLFDNGVAVTGLVPGTGSGTLSFGAQSDSGTYIAIATSTTTGCLDSMTSTPHIAINPLPTVYAVSGGGPFCSGGTGVRVNLSGSTSGVNYKFFLGATQSYSVAGTGSALSSSLLTAAGTYTVTATTTLSCISAMSGSAIIVVNPLPNQYTVTGGGAYCSGGIGVTVGLSNSDITCTYQLYLAGNPIGTAITGTGGAISFGPQTSVGTYAVVATNITTECTNNMLNSVVVTIAAPPTAFTVGGGGGYCAGGSGLTITLTSSALGVNYQLFDGVYPMGSAVAGTGAALTFGPDTAAGTYTIVGTATVNVCSSPMSGSAVIVENPLPLAFNVTGGGSRCAGASGVLVGLSGSVSGFNYALYLNGLPTSATISGTGLPVSFGPQLSAGTYTVISTSTVNPCSSTMTGSATVTVNPLPTAFTVTGGGNYCSGGTGLHVGLSGSTAGVQYQLNIGGVATGMPLSGTGSAIDFGLQTDTGTYTVTAANSSTTCSTHMTGSVNIATSAPPAVYTLMGGGSYCAGGAGVDINLAGSSTGVSYQLFVGSVPAGAAVTGTGGSIDFGPQTSSGSYTAIATSLSSACTSNMSDTLIVSVNPLPNVYSVTGGGSYCPGGAGVTVALSGSDAGVSYQLYSGGLTAGAAVAGSGSSISFGLESMSAMPYTAIATNPSTGCTSLMSGSATVTGNPAPNVYIMGGGGSYCAGLPGVEVSLGGSDAGVNYQLFFDGSPIGTSIAGTGGGISFGLDTAAGTYTAVATTAMTGCKSNMAGTSSIAIIPLPTAYTVTGGGAYCTGGSGSDIKLGGSASGVNYQLYRGTSAIGSILPGSGDTLDFGLQTTPGAYTVTAASAVGGCQNNMTGSATISINPLPTAYSVTGGGNYCAGGAGVAVGLSGSNVGISYELYLNTTALTSMPGTGSALNFGMLADSGAYTVMATNTITSCMSNMSGMASVAIDSLPAVYTVTGGGTYCAGSSGLTVYTSNSDLGVNYQLYEGSIAIGSPMAGNGAAVDFGAQTGAGNYTVVATNATTGCSSHMAGSASISTNPLPTAFTVTGGGGYCAGGIGSIVSISGTQTGVTYQVYHGSLPVGFPQAGTGYLLALGYEPLPGAYTVIATSTSTGCTNTMTGSVTVSINPAPASYAVIGGGSYCSGGGGADVAISGTDHGVTYKLYDGATLITSVTGTGSAIDFGMQTAAGIYTVTATNGSTDCASNMTGGATISINPLPSAYTVTGGGSYCAGGSGEPVGLSSSDTGVTYQLYRGSSTAIAMLAGNGGEISFGTETVGGTYTIVATNVNTGCTNNMAGSATIIVNSLPSAYAVIGGGSYCAGGAGFHIGLNESASGIKYQLLIDSAITGGPTAGTGLPLDFGIQTAPGTYTVIAIDTTTSCSSAMSGSASIVVNPLPTVFSVTGGGNYCSGGSGVAIGLSGSDHGISYSLDNGTTPTGTLVAGTGSVVSFGAQLVAGSYTVVATNISTSCSDTMSSSAAVTIIPTVTPAVTISELTGDTLCAGTDASFSAMVANGGTSPVYNWKVNGVHTGSSSTLMYMPANGDVISLTVVSNAVCPSPDSATASLTMTMLPILTPSVTISVAPGDTVCQGSEVIFTAIGTNGGANPGYTWLVNGATTAGTGVTYSYTPNNGDAVVALLNSSYQCVTDTIALSNSIGMVVESTTPPTVNITVQYAYAQNGFTYVDTLTAIVTNGGFAPTYQWAINNSNVPGATSQVFLPDSLAANDMVSCLVVNNSACGSLPASGQSVIVLSNEGVKNVTASNSDLKLIPNPNNGTFTIKGTMGTGNEDVSVEITDLLGQTIYTDKFMTQGGVVNEPVHLSSSVANAMYILTLRSGTETTVFHVVIEQ